jgi:hypothetical protein
VTMPSRWQGGIGPVAAGPLSGPADHQHCCLQLHSAPALSRVAIKLSQELAAELKAQAALQRLQGMLEPIIAASLGRSGLPQL